jgi:hypothetical protein
VLDTGIGPTVPTERLARAVGVRLDHPAVRRVEGRDETGNTYVRCFTRVDTTIHVAGEPSLAQDEPDVMFQEIVQDGLVGNAFPLPLHRHVRRSRFPDDLRAAHLRRNGTPSRLRCGAWSI